MGKNRGTLIGYWPSTKGFFEVPDVCAKFHQSRFYSVKIATVRARTDRQTDRDDMGDLIICSMLCYSNGTERSLSYRIHSFILFESGSMAHRTQQHTYTQTHTQKRLQVKQMSQPCYKTEVTEQCPQNSNSAVHQWILAVMPHTTEYTCTIR